ncbi:AMP-binding protein [Paracoccus onubensis]|uniref:AMP-binding protein n=1 Tax=Paracoccus onubensis TaxID=1675788 RepID=UPI00273106A5|nr:AMP-binding protein [Paracoccus onubensis]MDP0927492.1 AMP-binding protein [Paracoccus onubensis]
MTGTGADRQNRWFSRSVESLILSCGSREQNRPAIAALLDCIDRQVPIHARQESMVVIAAARECGPLLLCQSSGSTGRAKTIRRGHASWIASFEVNRSLFGLGSHDCYAVLGHLGHSLSLYAVTEAVHLGANVLALGGDGPRRQVEAIRVGKASVLYATPAQIRLLCRAGAARLDRIRHVICGGGLLAPGEREEFAAFFPNALIYEFYGAAETSFISISGPDTPTGSVGRPYPDVDLRLGNTGEIWLRSPYLFDGYDGEGSVDTRWRDGFLTVGEIGWLDGAGNLVLRGRKSRMVTVADVNVFLEDIERIMAGICGARSCAAVSVRDRMRGNAVIGFVEGGSDGLTAELILTKCRDALGPLSTPRRIEFLGQMPMLPSGKPDLLALQRFAEET